jgi:hypothetical protein
MADLKDELLVFSARVDGCRDVAGLFCCIAKFIEQDPNYASTAELLLCVKKHCDCSASEARAPYALPT